MGAKRVVKELMWIFKFYAGSLWILDGRPDGVLELGIIETGE